MFADLVLIVMMGLASLWLIGFVITLFVTVIDQHLAAVDYTEEIQRKYLS
jgi:hypothetical protein